MNSAIEMTDRTIRVGQETRPIRFQDHWIAGFVIEGTTVTQYGTWNQRPWTRTEIRTWVQRYRTWRLLRWNWLRKWFNVERPVDHFVGITNNCVKSALEQVR